MTDYYLKPTIKIEPLIWGWYAWPYLIPLITAASNIVERHLKIMQSYIQNPQVHAQAVHPLKRAFDRNRTLSGSNFDKSWGIAEKSKCKAAYMYAMNKEPWLSYMMALRYSEHPPQIIESNKFIEACKNKGIFSERLFDSKEWVL